jgi:hypothetical protein
MSETAIKSNEREAARLYERGVAAARGGQRRVAAGLLSRAVQLNPRHELAWLWLSGVLDDHDAIAFCLRSVLAANPNNERARQGLEWLEQQGKIAAQPMPAPIVSVPTAGEETPESHAEQRDRESWWVRWRRERRDMSRARLVFWSVPILLLLLTLGLNLALRDAVGRNTVLVQEAAQAPAAPPRAPMRPAILAAELAGSADAQALAYLSALDTPRAGLRDAVEAYRSSTSQPGGSSVGHAAAARKLRAEVDATYEIIEGLDVPAELTQAHNSYLAGLEIERQALDDMLEFYNSFSVRYANRATLRMVDAERQLDHARALWGARQSAAAGHLLAPQAAR